MRHWRDELLNLTRRDRVLYYRPTKTASLIVEAPSAGEVVDRLRARRSTGWRFLIPPDPDEDKDGEVQTPLGELRETDEILTQKKEPKQLAGALRTLDRRTTQEFMDKGIWVLYLAVGFLNWTDPDTKDGVRSPIVLIPVSLAHASPRDPMRLVLADEDPVLNPALAVRMESDFGITFPNLPDLEDLDLGGFFNSISEVVGSRGWFITKEMAIDIFSFHKEAMYRDLKDNEEEIISNEIIRALALGENSDVDLTFELPSEADLDRLHPPESLATIRDADASQTRCIVASRAGNSFVMDGPPGTGKSQTISNIIAQALIDGKTVLFVSEKIAALEVVKARLDEVGLGEYLLELHSHKSTRSEVAHALHRSLIRYPKPPEGMRSADITRLKARRAELSDYAAAMNEVRQPIGISLHTAIGRVAKVHDLPQAPLSSILPSAVDEQTYDRVLSLAGDLSRAWGPVARRGDFDWHGVSTHYASVGGKRTVIDRLEQAIESLRSLRTSSTAIAEELELWWNEAPGQAPQLVAVLEALKARREVPARWLTVADLANTFTRFEARRDEAGSHGEAVSVLEASAGSAWRHIDPGAFTNMADATDELGASAVSWSLEDETEAGKVHDSLRFAKAGGALLESLAVKASQLAASLGLRRDETTLERCRVLADLADMVGQSNAPEKEWLDPVALTKVRESAAVLNSLVGSYLKKGETLGKTFRPSVLDLDLRALKIRFDTLHTGLRKLGGAYRADKRLLAEHTYTGKVKKDTLAALPDAIEWKEIAGKLADAERDHSGRIGTHYYRGTDTRFEDVTEALQSAARATELARDLLIDRETFQSQIGRTDTWEPDVKALGSDLGEDLDRWNQLATGVLGDKADALRATKLADLTADLRASTKSLELAWSAASHAEETVGRTLTLGEVRELARLRQTIEQIERSITEGMGEDVETLGPEYKGLETDWTSLQEDLDWVGDLRQMLSGSVDQITAERLLSVEPDPVGLAAITKTWAEARDAVAGLFVGDREAVVAADLDASYQDAEELLVRLQNGTVDIDEWAAFLDASNQLAELGLADALRFAEAELVEARQVVLLLERATLETWIDWVLSEDERLAKSRSTDRDALVDEFRRLDHGIVEASASRVMSAVNGRRPETNLGPAGVIAREGMKKRRHMPVRDLLSQTKAVTQVIKPCFMMSPLSVSQFLTSDTRFDLVIFDEASQVRPSDAANSIYRGDQVIIAGDEKQLPPTDFFSKVTMDGDDDDYEEEQLEEFESVLKLAKGGRLESLPLTWHYRSQHESLITFSNYSFYEGGLITFPGALHEAEDVGVELFHVDGVYRRGGARDNVIEAEKVAERVLFHARKHPNLTLGVVAFSEAQASTIEYVLDQKRRSYPELDSFFTEDRLSGFFVKNLENVQGDERDLMIFSVGYGPDEVGKVTMNFGPLNKPGGWRRLNVAVTRARRRVEIVSSIHPDQFQPTSNSGPRHLQRYLDFARRGIAALALEIEDGERDAESVFEEEVIRVIRSWGYEARPQVGVANYRIDIGVIDPAQPGRYLLGVECDGAMYHSSSVARDRDRLRQEVLERLDWSIHRIWGTAWYRDRPGEEQRLREAIEMVGSSGRTRRRQTTQPSVELIEADFDVAPSWATPYKVHKPRIVTRLDMSDPAASQHIVRAIEEIVEVEAPVSSEVVFRRIWQAWGKGRSGSQLRAAYERALRSATRDSIRQDRRNFLWMREIDAVPVRGIGDLPESRRKVDQVPREELHEATLRLVRDAREVSWDDLTSAVAGLFGWARRGPDIAEALDKAVRALIRSGHIQRSGHVLRYVERPDQTLYDQPEG